LIAAVRAWFAALNRQNELVVTAPTGTAVFNVAGITLHSAGNLPNGKQKTKKIGNKAKDWNDRQYLIVDEVSMMDCKMLVNLDTNLKAAKSRPDDYFWGVNIIFMGDFLQLATVSHLDVYVNKPSECYARYRLAQ
jgi:ATP-dependent DNA helicase PIF1